jgi:hypothetical protein
MRRTNKDKEKVKTRRVIENSQLSEKKGVDKGDQMRVFHKRQEKRETNVWGFIYLQWIWCLPWKIV